MCKNKITEEKWLENKKRTSKTVDPVIYLVFLPSRYSKIFSPWYLTHFLHCLKKGLI